MLKHPEVLNHNNGRWSPTVNAEHEINDIPAFQKLRSIVNRAIAEHWSAPHGSIIFDNAAYIRNFIEKISFAPQLITQNTDTVEGNLIGLKAWSLEGLWNRLVYKKFEIDFDNAAAALRDYYLSHYNLKAYAKDAELILSKYIYSEFSGPTSAENKAFKALREANGDPRNISSCLYSLNQEQKNEFLSRAILMGYSENIIKLIIERGANVNAPFMGETPLMNAANNPTLLKVLLAAGAKVDDQTVLGKTALFYAVQFGDIHSVRILLDAGANVNHPLHSILSEKLAEGNDSMPHFYFVNKVLSFTPLIYAQRYADNQVIELLRKYGAKRGKANSKKIKEWIQEGKLELA